MFIQSVQKYLETFPARYVRGKPPSLEETLAHGNSHGTRVTELLVAPWRLVALQFSFPQIFRTVIVIVRADCIIISG